MKAQDCPCTLNFGSEGFTNPSGDSDTRQSVGTAGVNKWRRVSSGERETTSG